MPSASLKTAPPRVSVVIPTHRRPGLFARALASVLRQTHTDFEVVVIDDSGRDGEAQIATQTHVCSELQDHRVRYLVNEASQGAAEARNIGIREARGELVAFLDDDEDWLPGKLAKQVAVMDEASPETGVVDTGFYDWKSDGRCRTVRPKMQGWIFERLLSKTGGRAPKLSTVLCRKDALLECGLFDPTLKAREDYDLYIRLARSWQFESIMEPLSNKRADAGGRLTSNVNNFVQGYGAIYTKLSKDFASRPKSHAVYLLKYAEVLANAGLGAEARQLYWQAAKLRRLSPRLITYGYKVFVRSRS